MSPNIPLALAGAAEVLRLPDDNLLYLRHDRAAELSLEPGSVLVDGQEIVGFENDTSYAQVDCRGAAVVPGFVDCHTHLPFAGWRAREYAQKVAGASYAEIARDGGGIHASSEAFAAASDEEVLTQARAAAAEMLRHGTTKVEFKSGYGLSVEAELRALALADTLGTQVTQDTAVTALLAHAVPDGYTADSWMDQVELMLPSVMTETDTGGLDIFVESLAFGNDHLTRMGALAAKYKVPLRAHVEQLATHGSVPVGISAGARSLDHLSCMPLSDIPALAAAECAAVLLPGAEFMNAEQTAPGRQLADAGAICALATDFNPGTSPILSLPLIAGLAARLYGFSIKELLLALTLNPAWVLERSDQLGALAVGRQADVLVLDGPVAQLPYRLGHNPVALVVKAGRVVWVREDQAWRVPKYLRPLAEVQ